MPGKRTNRTKEEKAEAKPARPTEASRKGSAGNAKTTANQVDFQTTRDEARERFLLAIKQHRPEILTSLAEAVLTLYRQFYQPTIGQPFLRWWELRDANDRAGNRVQVASGGEGATLFQLERALWKWADGFNIATEWILDYALRTLARWCEESATGDRVWSYGSPARRFVVVDVPSKFRFEFIPWDQESDTWASYAAKLDEGFRLAKEAYRKQIKDGSPQGIAPAVAKREQLHFKWLVDFQIPVDGKVKSKSEIAREASPFTGGMDYATVEEGIRTLADLIGLKLRPSKRGRPRKS